MGVCFLSCSCVGYVKECAKGKKSYFNNILRNMKVIKESKKRLSKKINICITVPGERAESRRGGGGSWIQRTKANFKLDEYLRTHLEKIMGCPMVFGF